MSDPATGESYPTSRSAGTLSVSNSRHPDSSSEALGIVGSQIDFVSDLGIEVYPRS